MVVFVAEDMDKIQVMFKYLSISILSALLCMYLPSWESFWASESHQAPDFLGGWSVEHVGRAFFTGGWRLGMKRVI